MPAISLKAHFDGERILLDEPFYLPANTPLIVLVPPTAAELDQAEWGVISTSGLARAYGEDEPEYSLADVKS